MKIDVISELIKNDFIKKSASPSVQLVRSIELKSCVALDLDRFVCDYMQLLGNTIRNKQIDRQYQRIVVAHQHGTIQPTPNSYDGLIHESTWCGQC